MKICEHCEQEEASMSKEERKIFVEKRNTQTLNKKRLERLQKSVEDSGYWDNLMIDD